jgi:hypothetical protein
MAITAPVWATEHCSDKNFFTPLFEKDKGETI